ncbi:hypothetical protein PIECOFPK_02567 [Mycovorax composti]|uniref:Uncharacterized protein n=2 Tax=Chitinophagaceae TaxID=563835 RepID=A0ABZ2EMN0_9BACT
MRNEHNIIASSYNNSSNFRSFAVMDDSHTDIHPSALSDVWIFPEMYDNLKYNTFKKVT